MRLALCAIILSASAWPAESQERKFDVHNDGDQIEISVLETPESTKPKGFFDSKPPLDLPPSLTVSELKKIYTAEFRPREKKRVLKAIGRTKPRGNDDIRALLDLYNRHEGLVRRPIQRSLRRLSPQDQHFSRFFTTLLKDENPVFKSFALLGALQIRSDKNLPAIFAIASQSLDRPEAPHDVMASVQALRVLAAWKASGAFKLLKRQTKRFPELSEILATYYWKETLPLLEQWSSSKKPDDRARTEAAWRASVPHKDLRTTTQRLREIVLEPKTSKFARHQAAIKLGFAADDQEVDRLLALHTKTTDENIQTHLKTALFASRNTKVIPLLVDYAKTHPSALHRIGAVSELKEIMPKKEYRALLAWIEKNDPNEENRKIAGIELSAEN
jgi:hypothetical protein